MIEIIEPSMVLTLSKSDEICPDCSSSSPSNFTMASYVVSPIEASGTWDRWVTLSLTRVTSPLEAKSPGVGVILMRFLESISGPLILSALLNKSQHSFPLMDE